MANKYLVNYWDIEKGNKDGRTMIRQTLVVDTIEKAQDLIGRYGGFYEPTEFINDIDAKIILWAKARGLENGEVSRQMLKLYEEVGELSGGIAKGNQEVIKDSLGDIYVVLVILALRLGLNLQECIEGAYNEIKDRKGKLVNGVFIKEQEGNK
jgi:NTP pyrophosphatase (non-canonical NTP hydrolase)